jgi:hypothetical protein
MIRLEMLLRLRIRVAISYHHREVVTILELLVVDYRQQMHKLNRESNDNLDSYVDIIVLRDNRFLAQKFTDVATP